RPAEAREVPDVALRHLEEHAAGPPGPAEMIEADARELGEGDGEEREVHARDAETEREEADDEAERDAERDRGPQPGPRADAPMEEDPAGDVGADADVERVPERKLAREAHHDVPGLAGVGEVEDERRHRERVRTRKPGKQNREREKHGEAGACPSHGFLPNRPCGRRSSTRIRRPKLNMLLADGTMRSPARDRKST